MRSITRNTIAFLAALVLLCGTINTARAALKDVSPTLDPAAGNAPTWYQDQNNVALRPCLDANCGLLSGPGFVASQPVVFPTNFPEEWFYFSADSAQDFTVNGSPALVTMALESVFIDANGNLVPANTAGATAAVFQRLRVRIDSTSGVDGTYTIQHPWGQTTFSCTGTCDFTRDLPLNLGPPVNFAAALATGVADSISTFLTQTTPAPPAGYLGDGGTESPVTGGTVRNVVNIITPNLLTFTNTDFVITGKKIGLDVAPGTTFNFGAATITAPPTATAPQTVTITNVTGSDITFGLIVPAPDVNTNTNLGDFRIAAPATGDFCSGATVLAGGTCSFNIVFAPDAQPDLPATASRIATILLNPTTVQPAPPAPLIPDPPPVTLTLSGTAQFPLTVTVAGTGSVPGSGSVSSAPTGIGSCTPAGGANCAASFDVGASVTLTPTAATSPLSLFDGWSGACTNASGNCVVTMDAAKTATATFIKAWNVTTTKNNATATADGTITASAVVKDGAGQTVTVTPASACNRVTAFTDNTTPATLTPVTGSTSSYTLSGIVADHALAVAFDNRQAVTVTQGANGTISGGSATLTCGQNMPTFTITPSTKQFQVRAITKDGVAQTFTPATSVGGAVSFPFPAITTSSDTPLVLTASFMPSGDLDGNGALELADALKSLRIFLGTFSNPTADDLTAMDVFPLNGTTGQPTGDNTRDIKDVLTILKRAIGAVSW